MPRGTRARGIAESHVQPTLVEERHPQVMDVVIGPLIWLLNTVIELYIWVLIGSAILSWLVAFNVVNTRNRFVYMLGDFLTRITEPALRPIRRVIPSVGGIDLSPLVLILLLVFVQQILGRLYVAALIRG